MKHTIIKPLLIMSLAFTSIFFASKIYAGDCYETFSNKPKSELLISDLFTVIECLEQNEMPVGSIIASILQPDKFEKHFGRKWVLADGSRIPIDTRYSKITENNTLPDLRGMFLRGINIKRVDGKQDPDGERTAGGYQEDVFKEHDHKFDIYKGARTHDGEGAITSGNKKKGEQPIPQLPIIKEAGSGKETRPRNIAVYYYIKID